MRSVENIILIERKDFEGNIIGERAKRARHSQVCSIENRGIYVCVCHSMYVTFTL